MATANFSTGNASKIFALLDENTDFEFDWQDDLREFFKSELGKDYLCSGSDYYNDPSICTLRFDSKRYEDTYYEVAVLAKAGYYEGASLDWGAKVITINSVAEHDEMDSNWFMEDLERDLYAHVYDNRGMAAIQAKKRVPVMQRELQSFIDKVEQAMEKVSRPLVVTARFSNGEAMYQDAK